MTPLCIKNKFTGITEPVPCGKCPVCLKRKVSGWSFRLLQEDKVSENAHFVTLTYSTDHVPITKNGFMNLCKRDLQLFWKKLRKAHGDERTIKYYVVGEYGGRSKRPHYHAIIFNADLEKIQPAWDLGNVHYGEVSGASVGYTLKYMMKPKTIPMHKNDDRLPEFALMSKRLGMAYLTKRIIAWHLADEENRMYVNLTDGRKVAMPRYYKDKIYDLYQRKRIGAITRKKMLEKMEKEEQTLTVLDKLNKIQNDAAAFRTMHKTANHSRNKI